MLNVAIKKEKLTGISQLKVKIIKINEYIHVSNDREFQNYQMEKKKQSISIY